MQGAGAKNVKAQVDEEGGLPTRNPEELLGVFTLLTWAAVPRSHEAERSGRHRPSQDAIDRIAPSLRTLRHSGWGSRAVPRRGTRGQEGWLDHALAASGHEDPPMRWMVCPWATARLSPQGAPRVHHRRSRAAR